MNFDFDIFGFDVLPLPRRQFLELEKAFLLRIPCNRFTIDDERFRSLFNALYGILQINTLLGKRRVGRERNVREGAE